MKPENAESETDAPAPKAEGPGREEQADGTGEATVLLPPSEALASGPLHPTGPLRALDQGGAKEAVDPTADTIVTAKAITGSTATRATRASVRIGKRQIAIPEDAETIGPYVLLNEIARGGMGAVFRAYREDLNKLFALKLMLSGGFADAGERERFRREIRAVAKLDRHPHIVQVYDTGESELGPYYAMDFVEGGSLFEEVEESKRGLSPRRAAEVIEKAALALAHAHDSDIIHRDIKPQNLLLDAEGEPYLTDFGLAKDLETETGLTVEGSVLGSPSYMPPEQAEGQTDKVDKRSDIYALGATLFFALCGRPPFEAPTLLQVLRKVIQEDAPSPRVFRPKLHRDLETICLKAMDRRPDKRYQSARAMAEDLRAFLDGRAIDAVPIGALGRLARSARRQPALVALVAVLVLTGSGLGAQHWMRRATLNLDTDPQGATVFLDGEAIGETPLKNRMIAAGRHSLIAKKDGFLPLELEGLDFRRGKVESYRAPLVSDKGTLVVITNPSPARLRIGRLENGATRWLLQESSPYFGELPAGPDYIVEASAPDYLTALRRGVRLGTGRARTEVELGLEPDRGTLAIEGRPAEAPVSVARLLPPPKSLAILGGAACAAWDKERVLAELVLPGERPLSLPVGRYEARARSPGFRERRQSFQVRFRQRTGMRMDLSMRQSWIADLGPESSGAPLVFDLNDDAVPDLIIGRRGARPLAVSGDDGRALTASPLLAKAPAGFVPVGVHGGRVLGAAGHRLLAIDGRSGAEAWSRRLAAAATDLRLRGGRLAWRDAKGRFGCVDAASGAENLAARDAPAAIEAPVIAGARLVVFERVGYRYFACLISEEGVGERWSLGLERPRWSLVKDEALVVGSGQRLIVLDLAGGPPREALSAHDVAAAPAVADFDGDGRVEALVVLSDGGVYRVDGLDGRPRFAREPLARIDAPPSCPVMVEDLDGDGAPELVLATEDRSLLALDVRRGRELFRFRPVSTRSGLELLSSFQGVLGERGRIRALACADGDRDGARDVLLLTRDGVLALVSTGEGPGLWRRGLKGSVAALEADRGALLAGSREGLFLKLDLSHGRLLASRDVAVRDRRVRWLFADLDGDGSKDALLGGRATGLVALSGRDGAELWRREDLRLLRDLPLRAGRHRGRGVALAPAAGQEPSLVILEGATGLTLGSLPLPARVSGAPIIDGTEQGLAITIPAQPEGLSVLWDDGLRRRERWPCPQDSSPRRAFFALGSRRILAAYRALEARDRSGALLWSIADARPAAVVGAGDLDGDGVPDLVWKQLRGPLRAASGADGRALWSREPEGRVEALASLGDRDGDGAEELFVGGGGRSAKRILSGRSGAPVYCFAEQVIGDGRLSPSCLSLTYEGRRLLIVALRRAGGEEVVALDVTRLRWR